MPRYDKLSAESEPDNTNRCLKEQAFDLRWAASRNRCRSAIPVFSGDGYGGMEETFAQIRAYAIRGIGLSSPGFGWDEPASILYASFFEHINREPKGATET